MMSTLAWAQPAGPTIDEITMVPRLRIASALDAINVIEYADELATNQWRMLTNVLVSNSPYSFVDLTAPHATKRFYRVGITNSPSDPNSTVGMVLIPAGSFKMGDAYSWNDELPIHTVTVSAFYMDANLVTKAMWDEVYAWAILRGYRFDNAGSGKASNHPVQTVNWYDVVKWCNARSQKARLTAVYYTDEAMTQVYKSGRVAPYANWAVIGYRLPTEAEWEYASRGGLSGNRFPWGNTITHSQANYCSTNGFTMNVYSYDLSPTRGYHPSYRSDGYPYTSPVGAFAPNGYRLYDMAGNVREWCWDWYEWYSSDSQNDPRGPTSSWGRIIRGGSWDDDAAQSRTSGRDSSTPDDRGSGMGFRSALSPGQ
jgi:sulfatase modifying factor 1